MRNYTDFSDQAVLACIREHGGNPSKCTFIEQLSCKGTGSLERVISIWQDDSQGWDNNDVLLYSVPVEQWNFWKAPQELIQKDALAMMDFYFKAYDPWDFNCRDLALEYPSIRQLTESIYFAGADRVQYDEENRCFKATEYIQKPWYDSGGSIDAIDVQEKTHVISMDEAKLYWEEQMKDMYYADLMEDYYETLWSLRHP